MRKVIPVLSVFAIVFSVGLLITIGLHQYHHSFDPYGWLEAGRESIESRNLWNDRKDLYRQWALIFFTGSVIFGIFPALKWLSERRKIVLK